MLLFSRYNSLTPPHHKEISDLIITGSQVWFLHVTNCLPALISVPASTKAVGRHNEKATAAGDVGYDTAMKMFTKRSYKKTPMT